MLQSDQHDNFAPRIGIAWKPFGAKTVVRAGYGINYNLGQYASIVQNLAAQPPCANLTSTQPLCAITETNGTSTPTGPNTSLNLANGLPASPVTVPNNYGIDPNYRVAYVQMWNLNMQHEITPTLLLNVGYTGSKGSALDMLRAPNRGPDGVINPKRRAIQLGDLARFLDPARRLGAPAQANDKRHCGGWNLHLLQVDRQCIVDWRWYPGGCAER